MNKETRDNEAIAKRLEHDYLYAKSLGHKVFGVFLQGSQNYDLDYEGSDIDTKCIVLPSFEDIVLNKPPVSTTIELEDKSHLDLKDIRKMWECFKKQNINFIEILFTDYYCINTDYEDIWNEMRERAEDIAHYNNYAAVNCIAGMVFEKHKALCHPYPSLIEKIEKYGYDNKQLHHIIRCEEFLKRYIAGVSYKECLIPTNAQHLVNVKSEYIYSLEEAKQLATNIEYVVKLTKDAYMENNPVVVNKEVETFMQDTLVRAMKRSMKQDILENDNG